MTSKTFLLLVFVVVFSLISTEVAPKNLPQTSSSKENTKTAHVKASKDSVYNPHQFTYRDPPINTGPPTYTYPDPPTYATNPHFGPSPP